jgi:hypothetical protein
VDCYGCVHFRTMVLAMKASCILRIYGLRSRWDGLLWGELLGIPSSARSQGCLSSRWVKMNQSMILYIFEVMIHELCLCRARSNMDKYMQHHTEGGRSGKTHEVDDMSWTRQTEDICAGNVSAHRVSVSVLSLLPLDGRESAITRLGCPIGSQRAVLTAICGYLRCTRASCEFGEIWSMPIKMDPRRH